MLKSFNGYTEQLFNKPFKRVPYTVYNFIAEDGYLHYLRCKGFDDDIDELEYLQVTTDEDEKKLIKANKSRLAEEFKYYINSEVQDDSNSIVRVFTMREYGVIVVIKPKSFDILSIAKENE